MSRTAVLPQPTPEPVEPGASDGSAAGPTRDAAGMARAGRQATADGRDAVAAAVDESDDWEPPAPDVGEEDQSLEAPDDEAQGQAPFC